MKLIVSGIALAALLLAGCKKPVTMVNSGIYRGTFCEITDNGDTLGSGVANLTITESSLSFQLSGDSTTGAPKSCYGTYTLNGSTQITFVNNSGDTSGLAYHPNLVLDNTYNYTFDDHFFNFSLQEDTILFEYKLIRD